MAPVAWRVVGEAADVAVVGAGDDVGELEVGLRSRSLTGIDCEAQPKYGDRAVVRMVSSRRRGKRSRCRARRAVGEGRGELDQRQPLAGHRSKARPHPCPRAPAAGELVADPGAPVDGGSRRGGRGFGFRSRFRFGFRSRFRFGFGRWFRFRFGSRFGFGRRFGVGFRRWRWFRFGGWGGFRFRSRFRRWFRFRFGSRFGFGRRFGFRRGSFDRDFFHRGDFGFGDRFQFAQPFLRRFRADFVAVLEGGGFAFGGRAAFAELDGALRGTRWVPRPMCIALARRGSATASSASPASTVASLLTCIPLNFPAPF